jgi:hypothetical protein
MMTRNFFIQERVVSTLMKSIGFTLILFFVFLQSARPQKANALDLNNLSSKFDHLTSGIRIPAFSIARIERSGSPYIYVHGPALWSEGKPLTINSIFRIYSMTKAIASVGMLQLVEQKQIALDDPLNQILPEMASIPILMPDGSLKTSATPITLRQLMTHTAGFAYIFNNQKLADFKKPEGWPYKDYPRVFEPGTRYYYGTNVDWVGRLIEKLSGMDLETYLKKNVTGPLGMSRTFFSVPDSLANEIVSMGRMLPGDSSKMNELKDDRTKNIHPTQYNAGGGLFSTINDYSRFLQMILNGGSLNGKRILRKETVDMMFQNQIGNLYTDPLDKVKGQNIEDPSSDYVARGKWGLAWALDSTGRNGRSLGTAYWSGAANTYFSIDRKKGRAAVLFTNFFPFGHKEARELFYKVENEIYR